MRLEFDSHDGRKRVRVAHGDDCVAVMLDLDGIVLSADEALALAESIRLQAEDAKVIAEGVFA